MRTTVAAVPRRWATFVAKVAVVVGPMLLAAVLAVEQPQLRVYAFDPGDMRTAMHQRAFPGEDISDRPLPETVVPAVLRLLDERPPSGRLRASDLLTGLAS